MSRKLNNRKGRAVIKSWYCLIMLLEKKWVLTEEIKKSTLALYAEDCWGAFAPTSPLAAATTESHNDTHWHGRDFVFVF